MILELGRGETFLQRELLLASIATAEKMETVKLLAEVWTSMLNLKCTCVALAYHEQERVLPRDQQRSYCPGLVVYDRIYDGGKDCLGESREMVDYCTWHFLTDERYVPKRIK